MVKDLQSDLSGAKRSSLIFICSTMRGSLQISALTGEGDVAQAQASANVANMI
jgi:hypothetical protein